jgi:glucosylceramidase
VLEQLHALWPVPQLATEATAALGTGANWWRTPDWSVGEYYGTFILNDLRAWSTGFLDWNIMLDHRGAPDHGDPTGELCEGLIPCGSNAMLIVDDTLTPPVVYRQAFFWYMAHVSRWVPRGSTRIGLDLAVGGGAAPPEWLLGGAFVPPGGGSTTVVLMNAGNVTVTVCAQDGRWGSVAGELPPHSIQTWTYP